MNKSILVPYQRYKQLVEEASLGSQKLLSTDLDSQIQPKNDAFSSSDDASLSLIQATNNNSQNENDPLEKDCKERGDQQHDKCSVKRLSNDVIVACLSKRKHEKARNLLEILIAHPKLDWTKEGRLLYNSVPIENSHIVDLINSALDTNKLKQRCSTFPNGYFLFRDELLKPPGATSNTTYSTLNPTQQDYSISIQPPPLPGDIYCETGQLGHQTSDRRRRHTTPQKLNAKNTVVGRRKNLLPFKVGTNTPPPPPPPGIPDISVQPKSLNPWKDRWQPY